MLAAHSIYRSWLGLCAANVIRPQPPCGRSSTDSSFSTSCFDLEKKNMSDQRIRSLTWFFCRSAQKSILRWVKFVLCLLHRERWLGCPRRSIYLFVRSFISLKLVRSILDVSAFRNCSLFGKNVYYGCWLGNWKFEVWWDLCYLKVLSTMGAVLWRGMVVPAYSKLLVFPPYPTV